MCPLHLFCVEDDKDFKLVEHFTEHKKPTFWGGGGPKMPQIKRKKFVLFYFLKKSTLKLSGFILQFT